MTTQLQLINIIIIITIKEGKSHCEELIFFTTPKRNIGDLKFKDDREVDTVVTRQIFKQDTDWYKPETERLFPQYGQWFRFFGGACGNAWKSNGTEIQKSPNLSSWNSIFIWPSLHNKVVQCFYYATINWATCFDPTGSLSG